MSLTAFYISQESGVKVFLLWFINNYSESIRYHDPKSKYKKIKAFFFSNLM